MNEARLELSSSLLLLKESSILATGAARLRWLSQRAPSVRGLTIERKEEKRCQLLTKPLIPVGGRGIVTA